MPESVLANKKLLMVAVGLGLLAMILLFVYGDMKERQLKGDLVGVLKWRADLAAGTEATDDDLEVVRLPRTQVEATAGAMTESYLDSYVRGKRVQRPVNKGQVVQWSDMRPSADKRPSVNLSQAGYGFPVEVDPDKVPDIIRVDDSVDLVGVVSTKTNPAEAIVLVQNLRVMAVGGKVAGQDVVPGEASVQRNYRKITVEMTPQVAVVWAQLQPRLRGKVWVAVRNPENSKSQFPAPAQKHPYDVVNPLVKDVLATPLPESPYGGGGSYGPAFAPPGAPSDLPD